MSGKTIKHRRLVWEFCGLLFDVDDKRNVTSRNNPSSGLRDLLLIGESLDATGVHPRSRLIPLWDSAFVMRVLKSMKISLTKFGLWLGFVWIQGGWMIQWSKRFGHFSAPILTMDKLICMKVGVGLTSHHHYRSSSSLWGEGEVNTAIPGERRMSLLPRWHPRGGKEIISSHFSPSQSLLSHYLCHYHNHYYQRHYPKKAIHKRGAFSIDHAPLPWGVFGEICDLIDIFI